MRGEVLKEQLCARATPELAAEIAETDAPFGDGSHADRRDTGGSVAVLTIAHQRQRGLPVAGVVVVHQLLDNHHTSNPRLFPPASGRSL